MDHVENLICLLESYAPDAEATRLARQKGEDVKKLGEDRLVNPVLVMVDIIADGLRYSNWPWTPLPHRVPRGHGVQIGDFNEQTNFFN